jgi:penicillin amidase
MDTPEKEELNDVIICAFSKAVSELSSEYGSEPDNWQWGKMHQLALAHPLSKVNILNTTFRLNPKSYPVGGSFHTVSPFSYNIQKPFKVEHGSSHRHIYDLNNWDNSLTIIPTGNSGIPASKHYCDQTDMYVAGKYHADYFSKEKVVANAKYHMVFQTVR